jgi:hypothetical protein
MTMYLPNDDIRPTGYEAGEFLDSPPLAPMDPRAGDDMPELDREDDETGAQ